MLSSFSLSPLLKLFGKGPAPAPTPATPVGPRELSYADLARANVKTVLTGDELLNLLGQAQQMEQIRELMGLPAADWQACCVSAIRNFAEAVQLAPASEAHHHAFCGGLLVHTLEAIVFALKLRRRYQLPAGAGAERLNEAASRWSYGVFCAVLLHDPGKVGTGVSLLVETAGGETPWSALNGSMRAHGITRYKLTFSRAPYRLHNQVGLALFASLLPEPGRQWLSADSELLQQLLAAVYDVHAPGSGAIGEILVQADGMSVAANLGQSPARGQTTGAKSIPLVDKYMRTLRQLIASNRFGLNKPGAQFFVTKQRRQAEADADCWILCRSAAEAVIAELRQSDLSVPTAPERFYDTLQEHGMCEVTPSGRAIWICAVHSGDWATEFSMLRFKALRLWGPGKVPAAFAGSVKPRKKAGPAANSVLAEPLPKDESHQQTSAPEEGVQESTPAAHNQEVAPKVSIPAAPVAPKKAVPAPTAKQAALLASLLGSAKVLNAESRALGAAGNETGPKASGPGPTAAGTMRRKAESKPGTSGQQDSGPTVRDAVSASEKGRESGSGVSPSKVKEAGQMVRGEAAPSRFQSPPAPTSSAGIALAEAFFAWVTDVLKRDDTQLNTPQALFHVHADGLLMVTPLVYQTYAGAHDWMQVQAAVDASSYLLSISKRQVHHYIVKSPGGQIGNRTLACGVVMPAACKVLFGELGEPNPFILGRK